MWFSFVVVEAIGGSNSNIGVPRFELEMLTLFRRANLLQPEARLDIASNNLVCFDNLLNLMLNKVIVRVDVLLD